MKYFVSGMAGLSCGVLLSCVLARQEEGGQVYPQEVLTPVERLEQQVDRMKWRARLGDAFMERALEPFDRWLKAPGIGDPLAPDKERFYAVGIVPQNKLQLHVWVKFRLFYDEEKMTYSNDMSEDMGWYMSRKARDIKAEFAEKVLLAFEVDHEEARETITFGTTYFVRLATQDSVPENFKKNDVIYKGE